MDRVEKCTSVEAWMCVKEYHTLWKQMKLHSNPQIGSVKPTQSKWVTHILHYSPCKHTHTTRPRHLQLFTGWEWATRFCTHTLLTCFFHSTLILKRPCVLVCWCAVTNAACANVLFMQCIVFSQARRRKKMTINNTKHWLSIKNYSMCYTQKLNSLFFPVIPWEGEAALDLNGI